MLHIQEKTNYKAGYQHGLLLKEKIIENINFYKSVLTKIPNKKVPLLVKKFKKEIEIKTPHLLEEMRGIADSCGVSLEDIVLINSRSELIAIDENFSECTAFYFKKTKLLCQTWDWSEKSLNLVDVIQINVGKNVSFLGILEAGFVGKIGFNKYGIGVTLNFLRPNKPPYGLPIHVLLRLVLECKNIEEAKKVILEKGIGVSGNIILADSKGNCINVELDIDNISFIETTAPYYLHTNHYTTRNQEYPEKFSGSIARYKQGYSLLEKTKKQSLPESIAILNDTSCEDSTGYICRPYKPDTGGSLGNVGTIMRMVMDLNKKEFYCVTGNNSSDKLTKYKLK